MFNRLQREQLVLTPKTREDLENLEYGLNELNHLTSQIEKSRARKSIFADENDLLSWKMYLVILYMEFYFI